MHDDFDVADQKRKGRIKHTLDVWISEYRQLSKREMKFVVFFKDKHSSEEADNYWKQKRQKYV